MCSPAARSVSQEIENRQTREFEEKEKELAKEVADANLKHISVKVLADMETLKDHVPSKQKEAREAALDVQYLRQRQQLLVCS